MENTIFVIVEQNYEAGVMTWLSHTEEEAKAFVADRIEMYWQIWKEQGYTPEVYRGGDGITVKEFRDDIYADFYIEEADWVKGSEVPCDEG